MIQIGFDFVSVLVLYIPATCENLKSFGAFLNVVLFSFLDKNFQKKKQPFQKSRILGQLY